MPQDWYNLSSHYGTRDALVSLVGALRSSSVDALVDMVLNHRTAPAQVWCHLHRKTIRSALFLDNTFII